MPYDDDEEFAATMAGTPRPMGGAGRYFGGPEPPRMTAGAPEPVSQAEFEERLMRAAEAWKAEGKPVFEEPLDPLWTSEGRAKFAEQFKRQVAEPAMAWWEYTPRQEKFMDILRTATDIVQPGKGAGQAAVFGAPGRKAWREAVEALAKATGEQAPKEVVDILEREVKREAAARTAQATFLKKARGSVMKKGTPLGDLTRKLGIAPGAEGSVVAKAPIGSPARATAQGAVVTTPLRGGEDPATLTHILGHEMGHVHWNRIDTLARLGDPDAIKVMTAFERAIAAAPATFRKPGGLMGAAIEVAEGRARDIPEAMETGIVRASGLAAHGPRPFGERVADLYSKLLTERGQRELSQRQRNILSEVMDLY